MTAIASCFEAYNLMESKAERKEYAGPRLGDLTEGAKSLRYAGHPQVQKAS